MAGRLDIWIGLGTANIPTHHHHYHHHHHHRTASLPPLQPPDPSLIYRPTPVHPQGHCQADRQLVTVSGRRHRHAATAGTGRSRDSLTTALFEARADITRLAQQNVETKYVCILTPSRQ